MKKPRILIATASFGVAEKSLLNDLNESYEVTTNSSGRKLKQEELHMKMLERQRAREEKIKIKEEQIKLKQQEAERAREEKERQRQENLRLKVLI